MKTILKKIIAFPLAWLLFGLGDLTARFVDLQFKCIGTEFCDNWYQSLMHASMDVQDWAGVKGPWKRINDV